MINQNLNTDIGLSNGTMGKIHDIVKNKSGKIYEFFQNREKIFYLKKFEKTKNIIDMFESWSIIRETFDKIKFFEKKNY